MKKTLLNLVFTLLFPVALNAQVKINIFVHLKQKTSDSLFIAGNFNNWTPDKRGYNLKQKDSSNYFIQLNLARGDYEFKITRGDWQKVESQNNGRPIANRVVKVNIDTNINLSIVSWVDNFKQFKEEYHFGSHVHLVDSAFYMPQLNKHRKIWIYLPEDYSKSRKKYPVIYMQDGQNLFHTNPQRSDEWAVDTILDSLTGKGSKKMIIVGIDHGETDRLKEYNPYDSQYGKGEGKAYTQFLVETLKPFIDKNYRTLSNPENTSIAGSSMGGLISMYAFSEYPKTFGAAGIFSPAFWLAPKIYDDIAKHLSDFKNSRVFFVVGDKEGSMMVRDSKKIYNILNPDGKNKNIVLLEREDGKHAEWFWHREFAPFYQFISI